MSDERVRARVLVSGRVQGVFYRAEAASVARAAGLGGWARNLPDGRVEVVLEGPRKAVEDVIGWCGKGSSMARVEGLDIMWEPPESETGFGIR